jgi:hypothetical protein
MVFAKGGGASLFAIGGGMEPLFGAVVSFAADSGLGVADGGFSEGLFPAAASLRAKF